MVILTTLLDPFAQIYYYYYICVQYYQRDMKNTYIVGEGNSLLLSVT